MLLGRETRSDVHELQQRARNEAAAPSVTNEVTVLNTLTLESPSVAGGLGMSSSVGAGPSRWSGIAWINCEWLRRDDGALGRLLQRVTEVNPGAVRAQHKWPPTTTHSSTQH